MFSFIFNSNNDNLIITYIPNNFYLRAYNITVGTQKSNPCITTCFKNQFKQDSFVCKKCPYNCATCENEKICISCPNYKITKRKYNLEKNTCICDIGYKDIIGNPVCLKLNISIAKNNTNKNNNNDSQKIQKLNNNTTINNNQNSCKFPMFFSEILESCVCPIGYYLEENIKNCIKCDKKCYSCSNTAKNCTGCNYEKDNRYFEFNENNSGDCICLPNYFENQTNKLCQKCNPNCYTCYDMFENNCLSCNSSTVLIDNECIFLENIYVKKYKNDKNNNNFYFMLLGLIFTLIIFLIVLIILYLCFKMKKNKDQISEDYNTKEMIPIQSETSNVDISKDSINIQEIENT